MPATDEGDASGTPGGDAFGGTEGRDDDVVLTLVNRRGLHARAAARFVRELQPLDVEVVVLKDGQAVDGRSIMGLLMLGAPCGSTIRVRARGPDAKAAVASLTALVTGGFGEAD
ncbi:HPr family phosphocarrier protein [Acuticoccus sp.]|uniref:HPr family phosphocarrier protein n=1 Tax=Acuticoccus sp. TaxID=1904378 RepID=UPI003B52408D